MSRIHPQTKVISSGQESSPRQNPDPKYEARRWRLLNLSTPCIRLDTNWTCITELLMLCLLLC